MIDIVENFLELNVTLVMQLDFASDASSKIFFFSPLPWQKTVGDENSRQEKDVFFRQDLSCLAHVFVLDGTWMMCPTLAVPRDLQTGAALSKLPHWSKQAVNKLKEMIYSLYFYLHVLLDLFKSNLTNFNQIQKNIAITILFNIWTINIYFRVDLMG